VSDVDELIRELDLDSALARTYELGDGMRRRSTNRKRWATGGGLVAAAVVAALVVPSLGGDAPTQPLGVGGIADGGSTTEAPPTTAAGSPTIPAGYGLRSEGDIWILERQDAVPETTTSWDGSAVVGIGDAAATERGTVASFAPVADPNAVSVTFACVAGEQQLGVVRYRIESTRIVVDAEIDYDPAAAGCLPSSEGSTISLPLPGPYVPGTQIVAEPLHTP
jgi:hypothetical protein